ncbi:hypothetical protein NQ315_004650 [Exocentrus adspersus]|uniref:Uncharacterized protein n=1 Tax=Exocentrus adspersus TaxID=1586481 RepID=A0AAV8VNU6_9CUCU|nr:hypothetical protein NQ315_004650 [Exocentrus adspersus]
MKLLILYGIFSVIVLVSEAALSIYPADPNYPGSCYSDLTGKMEYEEVNTHLSGCARAICRNDGTIQVAT